MVTFYCNSANRGSRFLASVSQKASSPSPSVHLRRHSPQRCRGSAAGLPGPPATAGRADCTVFTARMQGDRAGEGDTHLLTCVQLPFSMGCSHPLGLPWYSVGLPWVLRLSEPRGASHNNRGPDGVDWLIGLEHHLRSRHSRIGEISGDANGWPMRWGSKIDYGWLPSDRTILTRIASPLSTPSKAGSRHTIEKM
jgi:hypothetical protein